MTTERPLRVGIVGGNAERAWAHDAHVPALKALTNLFTLDAVSARTQPLADQAAKAFGAPRAFGDSMALVKDPGIDVIAITCKVPEHFPLVMGALEAGKHIYCEWPLGRDVAEAEQMASAAKKAKGHVVIGLQALSAPAVRQAATLVASGALGQPLAMRVSSPTGGWNTKAPPHYAYLQDRRNGATLLSIAGGHTIAAMEAIAGAYTEVDARASILYPKVELIGSGEMVDRTCPDHVMVLGKHASGCLSTLEVIGGQPKMPFRMELNGTKGRLVVTVRHETMGGFQVNNIELETSVGIDAASAAPVTDLQGPPANVAETYVLLEKDIRSGQRSVPDFDLAVRLHKLLDAIEAASAEGKRQTLGR